MTTITIKNSGIISRTVFEDLADLQDFLNFQIIENREFSDEFKAEIDRREEELLSGKVAGIPWEEVKAKFLSRNSLTIIPFF